jgi:hypothetical protein
VATSGDDRPRLLHARSEFGYTDRSHCALPGEPEAVPADYQAELTWRSRREHEQRLRREWERAHSTIRSAVETFRESGPIDKPIWNATRAVERAADAVSRRLT